MCRALQRRETGRTANLPTVSAERNRSRIMSFQDLVTRRAVPRRTTSATGDGPPEEKEDAGQSGIVPRGTRGVRPRLETRCPVTSRALLDPSRDSFSVQSSPSESEEENDDPFLPTVERRAENLKSNSVYSHLTKEIVNLQVSPRWGDARLGKVPGTGTSLASLGIASDGSGWVAGLLDYVATNSRK